MTIATTLTCLTPSSSSFVFLLTLVVMGMCNVVPHSHVCGWICYINYTQHSTPWKTGSVKPSHRVTWSSLELPPSPSLLPPPPPPPSPPPHSPFLSHHSLTNVHKYCLFLLLLLHHHHPSTSSSFSISLSPPHNQCIHLCQLHFFSFCYFTLSCTSCYTLFIYSAFT